MVKFSTEMTDANFSYVIIINDGHVYQNIEKYSNNMYMHISIKRL